MHFPFICDPSYHITVTYQARSAFIASGHRTHLPGNNSMAALAEAVTACLSGLANEQELVRHGPDP